MTDTDSLKAVIQIPGQKPIQGAVVQTFFQKTSAELQIEFPLADAPDLGVGQVTKLVISGTNLGAPLSVPGRVCFQGRDKTCRLHFQVGMDEGTIVNLSMNRRDAVRVQPDPSAPIQLVMQDPTKGASCRPIVMDISTSGVGLLLTLPDEAVLSSAWRVQSTIELPNAEEAFSLAGQVRYRKLQGATIRYGVEFDPFESEESPEYRSIHSYVMQRQLDLIRRVKALQAQAQGTGSK